MALRRYAFATRRPATRPARGAASCDALAADFQLFEGPLDVAHRSDRQGARSPRQPWGAKNRSALFNCALRPRCQIRTAILLRCHGTALACAMQSPMMDTGCEMIELEAVKANAALVVEACQDLVDFDFGYDERSVAWLEGYPTSAPVRQIWRLEEGRISGSS
jgi:hypothetical protein